jgi:O-acetyl-ADP-ribose deacetylase (regulator of RNase III)
VDGAIHQHGGPEILAECRRLRADRYADGLPTGQAVATTAGRLPARWVIHTVGPMYAPHEDRSHLLRSCYVNALRIADELDADSVAFPLISAGVYGWPFDNAVATALATIKDTRTTVTEVRMVLYGSRAYADALRIAGKPPS